MRYGCPYKIIDFDTRALQIIKRAISNSNLKWKDGNVPEAKGRTPRKSEVTWINDNDLKLISARFEKHFYCYFIYINCKWTRCRYNGC